MRGSSGRRPTRTMHCALPQLIPRKGAVTTVLVQSILYHGKTNTPFQLANHSRESLRRHLSTSQLSQASLPRKRRNFGTQQVLSMPSFCQVYLFLLLAGVIVLCLKEVASPAQTARLENVEDLLAWSFFFYVPTFAFFLQLCVPIVRRFSLTSAFWAWDMQRRHRTHQQTPRRLEA